MAKAILLVEDSPDDALLFMQVMKKAGMANPVLVARDGAEAIAYFKGEEAFGDREKFPLPTILVLDLKMPRVSGFEVLEWLGTQPDAKKILMVVVSHSSEIKDINRAYGLGAHSFLTKPIQHLDLVNLASHFVGYWEIFSQGGTDGK